MSTSESDDFKRPNLDLVGIDSYALSVTGTVTSTMRQAADALERHQPPREQTDSDPADIDSYVQSVIATANSARQRTEDALERLREQSAATGGLTGRR